MINDAIKLQDKRLENIVNIVEAQFSRFIFMRWNSLFLVF